MNPDLYITIFTFSLLKARHAFLNSRVGQSLHGPQDTLQTRAEFRGAQSPSWANLEVTLGEGAVGMTCSNR